MKNTLTNFSAFFIGIIISVVIQNLYISKLAKQNTASNSKEEEQRPVRKVRDFYTSGWCTGDSVDNRMCHFTNLCFHPVLERFTLIMSKNSTFIGFNISDSNYLLDLSGVPKHDKLTFQFDVVFAEEFWNTSHPHIKMNEGHNFLMQRFLADNIFHVFHDDILPLYWTYHFLCHGDVTSCAQTFKLIVLDRYVSPEVYMLYRLFSAKSIELKAMFDMNYLHCFEEAYVGLIKYSVWDDFLSMRAPTNKPTEMNGNDVQKAADWIEERMCMWTQQSGHTDVCKENNGKLSCSREDSAHIVLLSRKDRRIILNENALKRRLEKISLKYYSNSSLPVKVVSLETHQLWKVICSVRTAKIVIGMHGSLQVIPSIFLPKGTGQIEMITYGINPDIIPAYKIIAGLPARGIIYRYWRNINRNNTVGRPTAHEDIGGLMHLSEEDRQKIMNMTVLTPLNCCGRSPYLYWMFQDTKVDLSEISKIVVEVIKKLKNLPASTPYIPVDVIQPALLKKPECLGENRVNTTTCENT